MAKANFDKMITKIGGNRSIVTDFDIDMGLWKTCLLAYDDTMIGGPLWSKEITKAKHYHRELVERNNSI
jgi:hypothetical protein